MLNFLYSQLLFVAVNFHDLKKKKKKRKEMHKHRQSTRPKWDIFTNAVAGKDRRKQPEPVSIFARHGLPSVQPWHAPLPVSRSLFRREPGVQVVRDRDYEPRLRTSRRGPRISRRNNRHNRMESLWPLRPRELPSELLWRAPLPACRSPFRREPGALVDRGTPLHRLRSLAGRMLRG